MKKISKFLAIPALALTLIPTNVFAASETANVKVSIPESLTLTLSADNLTFNLEDTDLHTDKLTVTAKTNAVSGYTISFNANNDYNDLKHSNALVEDLIPSVTEDKTESTFPETAWAYSTDISDYTFKKIPLESENIFATTEKGENNHDFTVGVRANNLAAGDYENELIFTAVANQLPLTLSGIYNMQEMTPEICSASATYEEKQLVDMRDSKDYWVTRMPDGKCWMTQNLDLDLDPSKPLTNLDSDINVALEDNGYMVDGDIISWMPLYAMTHGDDEYPFEKRDMASQAAWDPGDIYGDWSTFYDGFFCEEYEICTPAVQNNKHYHVGNLYNSTIAFMLKKQYILGDDWRDWPGDVYPNGMPNSICPKGWHLPIESSGQSEYENLMDSLNINISIGGDGEVDAMTKITGAPFYTVPTNGYGTHFLTTSQDTVVLGNGVNYEKNIELTSYFQGPKKGYAVRCVSNS